MAVKPINKITVRELFSTCGMNRNSFYYHFEDIYALFKWIVEAEVVEIVKQYDLMLDYHEVVHFVLDYVESNQHLLANAYNAVGRAGLKRFLYLDFVSCLGSLIDQGAQKQGVTLDGDHKAFYAPFMPKPLPEHSLRSHAECEWIQCKSCRINKKTLIPKLSFQARAFLRWPCFRF